MTAEPTGSRGNSGHRAWRLQTVGLFVALVMMTLQAAVAAPASRPTGSPASAAPAPVTSQEQVGVRKVIQVLYQAYVRQDLDRVLAMESGFVEAKAAAYEQGGRGKADDFRAAFRGCTEDVLRSKSFRMKPLRLADVQYRREGTDIVVSSVIPIISTERVEVGEPGSGVMGRLAISSFVFRKKGDTYEIVRMDLQ